MGYGIILGNSEIYLKRKGIRMDWYQQHLADRSFAVAIFWTFLYLVVTAVCLVAAVNRFIQVRNRRRPSQVTPRSIRRMPVGSESRRYTSDLHSARSRVGEVYPKRVMTSQATRIEPDVETINSVGRGGF